MTLMANLTLVGEAEDGAHYAEQPVGDSPPITGTIVVKRWALPTPTPSAVRVTLDFYEPSRPTPRPVSREAGRAIPAGEKALQAGDKVTIIKNRVAGINYPPEWLEQYLHRTGKVLWTTAGGAMVKLDNEATWFPYAELKVIA